MIRAQGVPAVAYYRMSTDKQEASIPAQREAVEKYAKQHGYHIAREYIDEGISGDATDKRNAFLEMAAAAEQRTFKAILCWDIDRFGRFDSIEAGHWIYPLRKSGVHLATVAQGKIDWQDFTGRVMYGIQQEAKNQYLTDLSRNVTRGMKRLAEQGKWAGGRPGIGYACQDKQLVLGASEDVALVRSMFRDYAAGKSLRGLADELNADGRLSPKGTNWTATGIAGILRNRIYIGDFVWNQRCLSKYKRKAGAGQTNEREEWIVFERHHPAIIDDKLFERVQEQMTARKNCSTPHPSGGGFVLTGLLVCGHCGKKLVGDLSNGVHQYTCYGYREHGKSFCDRNCLRQSSIMEAIVEALQRKYYNPATMAKLAAECRRQLSSRRENGAPDRLRAELVEVEAKLTKAKRRLVEVDADLLDVVQQQVRDLRTKHEYLTGALRLASVPTKARDSAIDAKVKAALGWFGRLQDATTKADPVLLRQFMREAFDHVELWAAKEPWTARRFKYRLDRGCLYLKGDNLLSTAR